MKTERSAQLKSLETRLGLLKLEKEEAEKLILETQSKIVVINEKINVVLQEKKKLEASSRKPIVTEHAVLRFIERAIGVGRKEIESRLLPPEVIDQIMQFGSGKFPVENGRIVVKDRVVLTFEGEKNE